MKPPKKTRVAIVHDCGIVVEGMVSLISKTTEFEVVERIHRRGGLFDYTPGPDVDVLVLGAGGIGSGLDGPELARRAMRSEMLQGVVGVFRADNMERFSAMCRCELRGFIGEETLSALLLDALRDVLAGQMFIGPRLAGHVQLELSGRATGEDAGNPHGISARQDAVFRLLLQGKQYGEIGTELSMATSTVATHVGRIRKRFGLPSRDALVQFGSQRGLYSDLSPVSRSENDQEQPRAPDA